MDCRLHRRRLPQLIMKLSEVTEPPAKPITEKLAIGPQAEKVIKDVVGGKTHLKHHPALADKLFAHFADKMPSSILRGEKEEALLWIEDQLPEIVG